MENEMVGCAIKCPPPTPASSPCCQSLQRDEYSLMPRRQGNEISRSSSRSFSFSISASRRPSGWFIEAGRQFFIVVIARNILVWVSEAPTLLCGPRASLKFKEFPPTVHLFRLALYMILAGGGTCSDYSCCCFSSLNKHTSRDIGTEGGSEVLADRFNYFILNI